MATYLPDHCSLNVRFLPFGEARAEPPDRGIQDGVALYEGFQALRRASPETGTIQP